jgi:hypothetical protein
MRAMNSARIVAAAVVVGCGGDPPVEGTGSGSSGGLVPLPMTTSGAAPTEGTEGATSAAETTVSPTGGSGPKFDIGPETETGAVTTGGPAESGCKRVDVILAIDNSGSMQEEIAALAGPVFDSFPQTLLDVGNGLDDFQLAVIDACNDPPLFHDTGAGGACGYSTGANYMSSNSPDLLGEYQCVTELTQDGYMGTPDDCSGDNDDEQPASTAAGAVNPPASEAENAGFVRDDAVLFVVAITDEDEQPVPDASAQAIADRIVAAKGTVQNVVFLGIGGDSDCEGPYGGAEEADRLREVAQVFAAQDRGLFWDLCQGDLEAAFQAGLAIVDSACIDFEPPE